MLMFKKKQLSFETYSPSGLAKPGALLKILLTTSIISPALGIAYAMALHLIPIIQIEFLWCAIYAGIIYVAAGILIERLHVRAPMKAALVVLFASIPGLITHWIYFCAKMFSNLRPQLSITEIAKHFIQNPTDMIQFMSALNRHGHFHISSSSSKTPISGDMLTAIWIIEAVVMTIGPAYLVYTASQAKAMPYSEKAGAWSKPQTCQKKIRLVSNPQKFIDAINAGTFEELLYPCSTAYAELTIFSNPADPDFHHISVKNTITTTTKPRLIKSLSPTVKSESAEPITLARIPAETAAKLHSLLS